MPLGLTCQTVHTNQTQDSQLMIQAKEAEERHDFLGAAGIYQQLLKMHPNQPDVLQHLGLVYYLSGRFTQAIPPLEEAVKLDPSLWGPSCSLGISYYRNGEFVRAAASLRQTITLQPNLPEAEFWYGSTLIAQGQTESAIPYLRQAAKSREPPSNHNLSWQMPIRRREKAMIRSLSGLIRNLIALTNSRPNRSNGRAVITPLFSNIRERFNRSPI